MFCLKGVGLMLFVCEYLTFAYRVLRLVFCFSTNTGSYFFFRSFQSFVHFLLCIVFFIMFMFFLLLLSFALCLPTR